MANIIVVFPKAEDAQSICRILRRRGYSVKGCTGSTSALQLVDDLGEGIVVCPYQIKGMLYDRLYEMLPPSFSMLLIARSQVISAGLPEGVEGLELPLRAADLVDKIEEMAASGAGQKRVALHGKASRSAHQQEEIAQAKALLMASRNWTEEEAHRYLTRTSMDSGRSLVQTAGMIISLMTPLEDEE